MADVASPAHPAEETIVGDENIGKRKREDTAEGAEGADVEVSCVKKAKEDDQAGEQVEGEEGQNLGEKDAQLAAQSDKTVVLGPKKFLNAVELFSYFYKFLQLWPTNVNTNKVRFDVQILLGAPCSSRSRLLRTCRGRLFARFHLAA